MNVGFKGKFIVIVLGVLVLPPLSIGVQLLTLTAGGTIAPQATFIAIRMLAQDLRDAILSGDFTPFERLSSDTGLSIVADDGEELYARGPQPGEDARSSPVGGRRDYYTFQFTEGGRSGTVRLGVPAEMLSTLENPVRILPVTMAALLGFISIFLLFTLKSLSRSIRRFEEAIKHIATGDLDFPTASLATGDFASLGMSLDTLRCQLKDDRERRDRFIMGVSHDLKTPLAVIQGYLDAIDDGLVAQAEDPEKKMADYMAVMRTQADILGIRIARLVDLAKTTTDAWLASLEVSDFKIFFEDTLRGITDYCATRGFTVETRVSLQSPCVLAFDHDMTRRILENLIDNALAYGDPLVSILVSATRTGEAGPIQVRVENGGAGIAPEHIKRVFEPFFRADRSRNTGGFGLGLASVKSIVETHGWSIDIESEPGIRTTFIITIPYDGSIPRA